MSTDSLLFPQDPVLDSRFKGYPRTEAPRRRSELAAAGWNVLAGDLPLPIAVLKRSALEHNLQWMQQRVREWGVDLAPHGKTSMSPQIFKRQMDAGAWGLTFATVTQLAVGVAAGARRCVIANQVLDDQDLAALQHLLQTHADLRVMFLVDSLAQLGLIEDWFGRNHGGKPFELLLEIGMDGARTGCRSHDDAMALARAVRASAAVRLAGIECYEGLWATGESEVDRARVDALMDRVDAVAREAVAEGLFEGEGDEVIVSAGGSAVFDLVAGRLRPALGRPVRGLLRSGCYVTHDHGFYRRMVHGVDTRLGCGADCEGCDSLRPAMEVWASVQSCPEPGLALLTVGKRDVSFDMGLPTPIARAPRGVRVPQAVPESWTISALNDQHAYLRWDAAEQPIAPVVGERVALGISHPCTTFDKWQWMPVVEDDYRVVDAVTTHF